MPHSRNTLDSRFEDSWMSSFFFFCTIRPCYLSSVQNSRLIELARSNRYYITSKPAVSLRIPDGVPSPTISFDSITGNFGKTEKCQKCSPPQSKQFTFIFLITIFELPANAFLKSSVQLRPFISSSEGLALGYSVILLSDISGYRLISWHIGLVRTFFVLRALDKISGLVQPGLWLIRLQLYRCQDCLSLGWLIIVNT